MISMDLKRLLDHEVELFGLDLANIWKVIQAFAVHCDLYSAEHGDIQIASEDEQKVSRQDDKYWLYIAREYPDRSVELALTSLLRLPRILKHALRRTWLAWKSLHGEVSLDDLLIYSTIHTANSEAVAFLRDHWPTLVSERDQNPQHRMKVDLQAMWNAHMRRASDSEKQWLWSLVKSLFPAVEDHWSRKKAQGADKERYWSRITNGIIEAGAVRDQRVLQDVKNWKASKNTSTIVSCLMDDSQYTSVLEDILDYQRPSTVNLAGDDVLVLATALFEEMCHTSGVRASSESCPGFIALWRLQSRGRRFTDYDGWLYAEIEKASRISLHLQNDLEYFWGSVRYSALNVEGRTQMRHRIAEWAHASVDAEFLCRTLPAEFPYVLRHFVLGPPLETEVPEPDWQRWSWIADILLKAIQCNPLLMIPQAVMLLTEQDQRIRYRQPGEEEGHARMETICRINRAWVKALFPEAKARQRFADVILESLPDEGAWTVDNQAIVRQFCEDLHGWRKEGLS